MSCISCGVVYGRGPLSEADLAGIDRALAERATRLVRTRRGRVWDYIYRDVLLKIEVEEVERVLSDCEDDLLFLGLLPELGLYRVSLYAGHCGEEADREIGLLCGSIAAAVRGICIGPRHYQ